MTDKNRRPDGGLTVRTFWHGPPLDPCRLLCLRSFVALGYRVELFAYDPDLAIPDGIVRRDANEIWPTDQVLRYRIGEGRGSPALHANLFRLALLQRLGGWWVDADVILLRPDLPDDAYFFSREDDPSLNNAIMKFPAGHPLLAEAIEYCRAVGETAIWGQTGPRLLTELVGKYGLTAHVRPGDSTRPVHWWDVEALFDPRRRDEVRERSANAVFLHLCMEMWRPTACPTTSPRPKGRFSTNSSRVSISTRNSPAGWTSTSSANASGTRCGPS